MDLQFVSFVVNSSKKPLYVKELYNAVYCKWILIKLLSDGYGTYALYENEKNKK